MYIVCVVQSSVFLLGVGLERERERGENWVRRDWEAEMEEPRSLPGNPITSLSFPNQLNNSITETNTGRERGEQKSLGPSVGK
jgi:hypothetical protein